MMIRKETVLKDGWMFAMGTREGAEQEYRPVTLPHDWVISGTVECPENLTFREMSQGFFPRSGIGWYKGN